MENVFLLSYQGKASSIILSGVKFDDRHKSALIPESKLPFFLSADGTSMFKDVKLFQINPTDSSNLIEINNASQIVNFSNKEKQAEESQSEESQAEEKQAEESQAEEETFKITADEVNLMKIDELREVVSKLDPEFEVKGLSKTELKEKLMSYVVEE